MAEKITSSLMREDELPSPIPTKMSSIT